MLSERKARDALRFVRRNPEHPEQLLGDQRVGGQIPHAEQPALHGRDHGPDRFAGKYE
jgi:hypothetical protein